ncbi:MAG: hypothetical protein F6J92_10570 [Symploca sp. SIO1A3]|nr:hypothetical protein [Symploca sp. SIO1A3]
MKSCNKERGCGDPIGRKTAILDGTPTFHNQYDKHTMTNSSEKVWAVKPLTPSPEVKTKQPVAANPIGINTEEPGALSAPVSNAQPVQTDVVDNAIAEVSEKTQALLDKTEKFASAFINKAEGRFAASEEFMLDLIEGNVDQAYLAQRFGKITNAELQRELVEIEQIGNAIRLSIEKKGLTVMALKEQQATLQVVEEEANTATAVNRAADATNKAEHSGVMLKLRARLREQQQRKTQANLQIATVRADEREEAAQTLLQKVQGKYKQSLGQRKADAATPV